MTKRPTQTKQNTKAPNKVTKSLETTGAFPAKNKITM